MFNRFHYDYTQRIAENRYAIFEALQLNQYASVCEILPGWGPKVAIPLTQIDYRWKLILLDKQMSFLDELEDSLQIFYPKFEIEKRAESIMDHMDFFTDVIIWNHVIDDLLLDEYCVQQGINVDDLYNDGKKFVSTREELWKTSTIASTIAIALIEKFDFMINPGGCLILAQYAWETEKNFGLDISIQMCADVVEMIKKWLERRGFVEDVEVKNEAYSKLKTWFFPKEDLLVLRKTL